MEQIWNIRQDMVLASLIRKDDEVIKIEQYRLMLPNFTQDALYEERAVALGEEWQDRYQAIQHELHNRGLINDDDLARDPFDPATIAAKDTAYVKGLDDDAIVDLFRFSEATYAATETKEPIDQMIADEVKRRGLTVDV